MKTDELFEIWEKGNKELFKNTKFTKEGITAYLNKKTRESSWLLGFNIIFYSLWQLANIILSSMNIVAYSSNTIVQVVLIAFLVFSSGILVYSIILFIKYREIKNFSDSLNNLINKQLYFLKIQYEIWLILTALSVLILIFNVNIIVDYNGGYYPIYNIRRYIIINVCIFLFIYAINKITISLFVVAFKAYLSDLKKGILDASIRIEKRKKKYKWVLFVLVFILTIIFIAGLLKGLGII